LGRNGVEEIKNHQWFSSVNWNNLLSLPAPHVPQGSSRLKKCIEDLKTEPSDTPKFRMLIHEITANFDKFKEGPSEGATRNSKNPLISQNSTAPSTEKEVDDAFLGYTFIRQPKVRNCVILFVFCFLCFCFLVSVSVNISLSSLPACLCCSRLLQDQHYKDCL
jgi:hypothetical protein